MHEMRVRIYLYFTFFLSITYLTSFTYFSIFLFHLFPFHFYFYFLFFLRFGFSQNFLHHYLDGFFPYFLSCFYPAHNCSIGSIFNFFITFQLFLQPTPSWLVCFDTLCHSMAFLTFFAFPFLLSHLSFIISHFSYYYISRLSQMLFAFIVSSQNLACWLGYQCRHFFLPHYA